MMIMIPGFPASGRIRENNFLLESQVKSGDFVESQGKSGNFALTEVNQISTLIQMDFFLKPDVCQDFFCLAALSILKYSIYCGVPPL